MDSILSGCHDESCCLLFGTAERDVLLSLVKSDSARQVTLWTYQHFSGRELNYSVRCGSIYGPFYRGSIVSLSIDACSVLNYIGNHRRLLLLWCLVVRTAVGTGTRTGRGTVVVTIRWLIPVLAPRA
ncbi:hypothetical protein SG26_17245 (plasmid) [Haloarcula sp. CBA1115]|nr:hypothetical protein SG26_17245 [Haloarcula sp. CBA1115]